MDIVSIILCIVLFTFLATITIGGIITDRREREERRERDIFWAEYIAEFEKEKRRKLYEKETCDDNCSTDSDI